MKFNSSENPFIPKKRDCIAGMQDPTLVVTVDSPIWEAIRRPKQTSNFSLGEFALELASRLEPKPARELELERLHRLGSEVVMAF